MAKDRVNTWLRTVSRLGAGVQLPTLELLMYKEMFLDEVIWGRGTQRLMGDLGTHPGCFLLPQLSSAVTSS